MPAHRRKKKIMRAFKINELSAVDVPAQEGARMTIMKRAEGTGSVSPLVEKVALLTEDHIDGHSHLILGAGDIAGFTSFGGASDEDGHNHPWIKKADGSVIVGASHGHIHGLVSDTFKLLMTKDHIEKLFSDDPDVAMAAAADRQAHIDTGVAMENGSFPIETANHVSLVLKCSDVWGDNPDAIRHIIKRAKVLSVELPTDGELATLFEKAKELSKEDPSEEIEKMTKRDDKPAGDADVKEQLDAALAKQAETEVELKTTKKFADMTDIQKDHYNDLDPEAAVEFIDLSSEDKDAVLKNIADADKVIYKALDGSEYRTSDDVRLVKMAKDRDVDAKTLAKMKKDAEDKTYAKRAADELPHLPGTEESKIATLKALDKIEDEDTRAAALEGIHASNAQMAKAFETQGTTTNPSVQSAEQELDELVKRHAKEQDVEYSKAYRAVCNTPEGSALYEQSTQH